MKDVYLDDILFGKKGKYDPKDETGYGFKSDKKGKKNKDKDKRVKVPEIKNDDELLDAVMDDVKKDKKRAKKKEKKERERREDTRSPKMREIDNIIISI